ncbi:MAG TPA: sterol desaturase family protein [Pyrinomonadaceae bacterium]|jgi:sterol desaturase/sphingolipid hydroxylase (fatty acid hydroxylase superfamily)|nr:sterol desaturase family protein [Pyrinomonadaceae bacterium]
MKKILKILSVPLALAGLGALVWLENRRPLRRAVESKPVRSGRNLAVAAVAALALQIFEKPVAAHLTKIVERSDLGLLKIVRLPKWFETILAVVLMDYTLYLWHVLTHKVPFLWRFHLVHHVDLDLDASTAVRFHFGELVISVLWRSAQILVIGVSPSSFAAWQFFLFPSILFHHSNLRLPRELEKMLQNFIVTPRLHGIHHSIIQKETDSNWSSGLTVWDRIHGTFRNDAGQEEIVIGVPAYQNPQEVVLTKILRQPFEKQKNDWLLPEADPSQNQLK